MKVKLIKYSLLITIIFNCNLFTQQLNNFLDFPWGKNQNEVKELMLTMNKTEINSEGKDFVVFENGKYGDYAVKYWSYRFYNDSLYTVIIVMDSITIYDTLKIENVKNFVREQHILPFGNSVLNLDLTWLLSNSSGNLIGIIEIESALTLFFGSRIRVVFRYYPLLSQIMEKKKFNN